MRYVLRQQPARPVAERLTIREGGRIVIPAHLRAALGVGPGDDLVAVLDGAELRLLTPAENIRQIQDRLASLKKPGESIVDEFIAERRAEALRE
jgi:AbrB family looped-hinge helix DNA binding protein